MTTPSKSKLGGLVDFQYNPQTFDVTPEMKAVFDWDGCFVVRSLLNNEELHQVWKALLMKDSVVKHAFDVPDGDGRFSRMVVWNHPGNDITGMIARSEKVAGTCEKLLHGEVYHYHTRLIMKEAQNGGRHHWQQDYGYWYKNGNLRPDMMTVFIALDPSTKVNGGWQILKGSHRCGRVDHSLVQGHTVADPQRVEELSSYFEHVYAELQPGDALFLHCNVLHTSDHNNSDVRRWALLCSYNRADNNPVYKHRHPNYTPLKKVPNSAIVECNNPTDLKGKDFVDPGQDKTVRTTIVETGFH